MKYELQEISFFFVLYIHYCLVFDLPGPQKSKPLPNDQKSYMSVLKPANEIWD